MLRLESISKAFGGKRVIDAFSLEVGEGEIFILLGRSGCGKTTLLRLIAGFERPDGGRISIAGQDVGSLPAERRPAGFIFQSHALFPHMTVYDNIAVGPRIRKTPEAEIEKRVDELLETVRLRDLKRAFPGQLSGGESQRVALARAIVNRPKVLLLDEPLSALDLSLRQRLREELVETQKAFGITFLFVTHDQEEAMALAGRMGVLEDGRLLQVGPPEELYERPNGPFVAEFLGESNRLKGVVYQKDGDTAVVTLVGLGRVKGVAREAWPPGRPVTCYVRPEKTFLSLAGSGEESMNSLEGTFVSRSFLGNRVRYRVRLNNGETAQALVPMTQTAFPPSVLREGERVFVQFSRGDVRIFEDPAFSGKTA
ncbi:MAG: ABC transporter ATP-binding protein [Nitrospinae bacterium]|nr:ABC transporter ATP-binding protein [Nitrospinota bacterium]